MIGAQFFTTLNFNIFKDSLKYLTFKLPYIRYGNEEEKLETEFKHYLNSENSDLFCFYNGRSAINYALKSLNLGEQDEVLVSGYTCVVVVNAIIQAGLKPVYVDIDKKTLNMNIENLEKKITSKTKVLLIQHTFGNPVNMQKIMDLVEKYNLILIEDCAHALGAEIGGKKVGTFGDMAIFSSGRDKIISSVTGGYLLVNNKDFNIPKPKLLTIPKKLAIQNLFYNIFAYLAWKTYDIKLGKVIMYLAGKLKLIPPILTAKEKSCAFSFYGYKLPNSLAYLARKQLAIVDKMNNHRKKLAKIYENKLSNKFQKVKKEQFAENIYYGYPIICDSENTMKQLVNKAKKHNIYLGVYWSGQNISPSSINLKNCQYNIGDCPIAEEISKKIVVLPNHFQVKEKQVEKIINILNS